MSDSGTSGASGTAGDGSGSTGSESDGAVGRTSFRQSRADAGRHVADDRGAGTLAERLHLHFEVIVVVVRDVRRLVNADHLVAPAVERRMKPISAVFWGVLGEFTRYKIHPAPDSHIKATWRAACAGCSACHRRP